MPTPVAVAVAVGSVGVLMAHNLFVAVTADVGEPVTVVLNGALAAVTWAAARRRGLHADEMGVRPHRRGLAIAGAIALAAIVAFAIAAASGAVPGGSAQSPSPGDLLFRLLIGIPIGTALCEEVIFRGVLLAAWDRVASQVWATIATSALFGLWHVAAEARRLGDPSLWTVAPGVLATAAASALVLCPLRRRSGDLIAPIVLHSLVNAGMLGLVAMAAR